MLRSLGSIPSLQNLNLGRTTIDDDTIPIVARAFPNLTFLSLWTCKNVTAARIREVGLLQSLNVLDVSFTSIDDITFLQNNKALKFLHVGECKNITDEQKFVLLFSIPGISIVPPVSTEPLWQRRKIVLFARVASRNKFSDAFSVFAIHVRVAQFV